LADDPAGRRRPFAFAQSVLSVTYKSFFIFFMRTVSIAEGNQAKNRSSFPARTVRLRAWLSGTDNTDKRALSF
jgi:hypothetical protein